LRNARRKIIRAQGKKKKSREKGSKRGMQEFTHSKEMIQPCWRMGRGEEGRTGRVLKNYAELKKWKVEI